VLIAHAISESILRIVDVELGIDWSLIGSGNKGASTVREGSMDFENIGATTSIGSRSRPTEVIARASLYFLMLVRKPLALGF